MKTLVPMRILAQIIDISIYLAIVVASYMNILPFFVRIFHNSIVCALIVFVLTILLTFIVQYPFLKVNQTVGKGFFSLEIISTNDARPLTVFILLQRELLVKMLSCYMLCMPVLIGKLGAHEVTTETVVVRKRKIK